MYCTHCGAKIPEGAKFCNNCGNEIHVVVKEQDVVENQEVVENDTNPIKNDYLSLRTFVIKHKAWAYGYVVWVVIHTLLWLFGSKGDYHVQNFIPAKELFFPFSGEAENYDFTEFFVYVIAIPVLAYIAYYFYRIKGFKLRKITLKTTINSLVLAFCLSLSIYAIAMKPVEHYQVENDGLFYRYFMDVEKAEIPSFLGDTYHYNVYKHIFNYSDYPLYTSKERITEYPKMPLPFRLRVALMIMLSWKGLRFFILMLLLSYGVIEYMVPKVRNKQPDEAISEGTPNEANDKII